MLLDDGRRALTTSWNPTRSGLTLWDLETGEALAQHLARGITLAGRAHPDGKLWAGANSDGTVGLWDRSSLLAAGAAIVLFAVGNVAAFALGALVAAVQALRLEYYELFSRLFTSSGRPFTPWHVPLRRSETS